METELAILALLVAGYARPVGRRAADGTAGLGARSGRSDTPVLLSLRKSRVWWGLPGRTTAGSEPWRYCSRR